jgi:hypothetical protein
MVLAAVQQADARHYPDPAYTALRAALAAFHRVAAERIVVAGSASEFIMRMSAAVVCLGGHGVWWSVLAYGDYAHVARAWGLQPVSEPARAGLCWLCEPSSPLGDAQSTATGRMENGAGVDAAAGRLDLPAQRGELRARARRAFWKQQPCVGRTSNCATPPRSVYPIVGVWVCCRLRLR